MGRKSLVKWFKRTAMYVFILSLIVPMLPVQQGKVYASSNSVYTTAYIPSYNSSTLAGVVDVVDLTNGTVQQAAISVGSQPTSAAVNPNGTQVFVVNAGDDTVSVINPTSNTVTSTISVGTSPRGVAFNADGSKAYVTNNGSDNISIIDTSSLMVTSTISTAIGPVDLVVVGSKLYVLCANASQVDVVDLTNNTVGSHISVGSGPNGLSANPAGTRIYVANENDNTVSVIDTSNDSVTATVSVGSAPKAVEVSPDGSKVYVANRSSNSVSVIDANSNTVTNTITVGAAPSAIGISQDGTHAYAINVDDASISVINTSSNTVGSTISGLSANSYLLGKVMVPTALVTTPSVPSGLSVSAGNAQITLNWTSSPNTVTYSVYEGTSSGNYGATAIGTVTGSSSTYTATGLTNGTTYYFAVKATNDGGTSGFSNEASAAPTSVPTFTVTYNGNGNDGGSVPTDNNTYLQNASVTVAGNTGILTKTGYTFAGWNTQSNGNGTTYAASDTFTMSSTNVTLYAKWQASASAPAAPTNLLATPLNALVKLDWDAISGAASYEVYQGTSPATYGASAVATVTGTTAYIAVPNDTMYYFAVKAVNSSGSSGYSTEASAMASSMNPYTVIYDGNGNTGGSAPIDSTPYTDGFGLPVNVADNTGNLTRTGYTFAGWNTASNGSGTLYHAFDSFPFAGSANITLYAVWQVATSSTYSVTYDGNGNTGGNVPTDSNSYSQGNSVNVAGNTGSLTKTGYSFAGWNTQPGGNGTTYAASDTLTMGTSNITLYAKWTIDSYTVTFNSNGGSTVADETVTYITNATKPTDPTKTGNTFAGWYSDSGLTTAFDFTTPITANITLYAKWTINSYTVSFNSNWGIAVSSQSVTYNTYATQPTAPIKAGNTFAGWYSDSGLTTAFDFTTPITANITLNAKWTINSYTVTFNSNGGSTVADESVAYNANATKPTDPTKTGNTFAGWYSDSGLTTAFDFTTPITANTTLYAKWQAAPTYAITYDGNVKTGGSVPTDSAKYLQGSSVQVAGNIGNLTKTGYTFVGWNTKADGQGTTYAANATFPMGSANVTLYALWKATSPIITTIAGTGISGYAGDGGLAGQAQLNNPYAVAVDSNGNVYIADTSNSRIRKIAGDGTISTLAGTGTPGYSGDGGPANQARLNNPSGIAADSSGNVYVADRYNNRIRKIASDGTISTIAGTNEAGYSGDGGPADKASINSPTGIAVDSKGNVYFTDRYNNRIRKIASDGIISTVAGTGISGYSGDGGLADKAQLYWPFDVVLDNNGNLYIADYSNHRVRKVTPDGIISTVAGTGTSGYSGDEGPAINAQLSNPSRIAIDSSGNLYIADYGNGRIRKIAPDGTISTTAGTGTWDYSGDGGPAIEARISRPLGIAVDNSGNVYIADTFNHRIRKVTMGTSSPEVRDAKAPTITKQPEGATVNAGESASLSVTATVDSGTLSYQWYKSSTNSTSGGTLIDGATKASYEAPTAATGETYYYVVVTNTDNTATGNKTATVMSILVKVIVNAAAPQTQTPPPSQSPTPTSQSPKPSTPSTPVSGSPNQQVISTKVTTSTETDKNGKQTNVTQVNETDLQNQLQQNNNAKSIVIPVNTSTGKGAAKLSVNAIEQTASNNKDNDIVVQSNDASYTLPANLVTGQSISNTLGISKQDAGNAQINVTMEEKSNTSLNPQGTKDSPKLASKVVDFSVTVTSGDTTKELNDFGSTYVSRSLTLNDNANPQKSVGVAFDSSSNQYYPMPTLFYATDDGKNVAVLKRNGNSIYAVLETNVSLNDIAGHWGESTIQLLANKLIVTGFEDGSFRPNQQVTRAEYVTLLTRALGLLPRSTQGDSFTDVPTDAWYAGALTAAKEYDLAHGYADGTFRPDQPITRQEAALFLANAIDFLKLRGQLTDDKVQQALGAYKDADAVSVFARDAVGLASALGILQGGGDGLFRAQTNATRAETATMIKKLMELAGFISS